MKVQIQTQEMEIVPMGAVKLHPRNPRKGDLRAVRQSIERNGFVGALIANRRTGHILAGNHRYMAARELGLKEIPVIWVDVPAAREVKILLADNRASDLGSYDKRDLAALLQEVALEGDLLSTLYTQVDLQDLLGPPGEDEVDDPEEEWVGMPEFENNNLKPHRQLIVSFDNDDHVAEFARLLGLTLTPKTKATWYPPAPNKPAAHLAYVRDED